MTAVIAPGLADMPLGRGRPGLVEAGVGAPSWLPTDATVAWFRTTPAADQAAAASVVARTVDAGVEAGVPVVGLLAQAGLGAHGGLADLHAWASVTRAFAAASGQVPTVLVVDGPCLGGPALVLGLADIVVMTAQAHAFVNAPASSARITGSDVLDADLVGGSWVHGARTGLAHATAPDLDTAIDLVADLLDLLPANAGALPPVVPMTDPADRRCDVAAAAVPTDYRASYDVRTVVADIADVDSFVELRAQFGTCLVTGLARVAGQPVGIVANQPAQLAGALDIDGSQKGGAFVRFCDAFNIPLLTLVDTPGFRPGRDQEWRGMIRHGAKLAFAYAEATVPRVCVVLRKAYGGAYIVMDCKSMGNDCALAWPTAEIAVMGARGAVEILGRRDLAAVPDGPERETRRAELEADYEEQHLSPAAALDRGFVDDIVDPAGTRRAVAGALAALAAKRERLPSRRHENIPL